MSTPVTGTRPDEYLNINPATGLYSISPGRSREGVGQYTIGVTSVTLNGISHGASLLSSSPPSSFLLTVTTGCEITTLTPNNPQTISLTVFDPPQFYPSVGEAF